ncbi:MAG: response regulator transcription factor [Myxococcaceae bacterium]|nr:response regulator transcription factor [Myxococcaceae bacterium]
MRLLVVDDDAQVRRGLSEVLGPTKQVSIVGSCGSAAEALEAVARGLEFEVALIDLHLPDRPGNEVLRSLARSRPQAVLLAFTQFDDAESIFAALESGASGYLLKTTSPPRLLRALGEARDGGAPMTPSVARKVVESFRQRKRRPVPFALSERESDVLRELAMGRSYADTGAKLGIGLGTVQTHVKNIYRKLEVNSREEAADWAATHGLLDTTGR